MTTEKAIELLHRLQDEQFDGIHGDERREALEMAVRALEQNLVQESGGLVKDLVKDCISRTMAIGALNRLPKWSDDLFSAVCLDYSDVISVLSDTEKLPSAQPELLEHEAYIRGFEHGRTQGMIDAQERKKWQQTCNQLATDCISRQAAVDICANAIDLWHGQIGEGALVAVRDKIAELTPAEPKKGRWIEISSITHTYKCSVCGRLLVNVADGRNNVSKHYPYCHCGADMRGEQNG